MNAHEREAAKARLERDYLAGAISADEYTRLRRQLEEEPTRARAPEPEPATTPTARATTRGYSGLVAERPDPVTGAPLASWGQRAGGWFIDLFVYIGIWIAVAVSEPGDALATVVVVFGPTVYQWLMVGRWGQTLGKMAVGIRVVASEDGSDVSYLRALGRAASVWVLGLLFLPLLLAYLWPLWDRRKQTIYHKMASTIVVETIGSSTSR